MLYLPKDLTCTILEFLDLDKTDFNYVLTQTGRWLIRKYHCEMDRHRECSWRIGFQVSFFVSGALNPEVNQTLPLCDGWFVRIRLSKEYNQSARLEITWSRMGENGSEIHTYSIPYGSRLFSFDYETILPKIDLLQSAPRTIKKLPRIVIAPEGPLFFNHIGMISTERAPVKFRENSHALFCARSLTEHLYS